MSVRAFVYGAFKSISIRNFRILLRLGLNLRNVRPSFVRQDHGRFLVHIVEFNSEESSVQVCMGLCVTQLVL